MALLLKSLRQEGITVPTNPEVFIESHDLESIDREITKAEVSFDEWKRVPIEEKGKKKMVMKIVKVVKPKTEYMTHIENQVKDLKSHVHRMKTQYEQIKVLKDQLIPHHAIIHMDFAENYSCKSVDEIQSAYWNQQAVTLHPAVLYKRNIENQPLQHQSYVIISDDLNHNASTVITFVREIIKEIRQVDPQTEYLHFWTDSPTSQYRNRTIFNFIANLEETAGIKACWNYFEAGHGKGPCDGLGGTTKRMADQAMKAGKVVIQDAKDFFAWTQSSACSTQNVKFRFIAKEQCEIVGKELEAIPTKTIKGTMKIHAIVGKGSNSILVREVSCYCNSCVKGEHCDTWNSEITSTDTTEKQDEQNVDEMETGESTDQEESYDIGEYVVAMYENNWYVGMIEKIDPTDENGYIYNISFMERHKKMFQWPQFRKDITWRRKCDVKFKVMNPTPSGKSKRMFNLDSSDWAKISDIDME